MIYKERNSFEMHNLGCKILDLAGMLNPVRTVGAQILDWLRNFNFLLFKLIHKFQILLIIQFGELRQLPCPGSTIHAQGKC